MLKKAGDEEICVVADGAAIGPEMNVLYKQVQNRNNIKLYLPESFEWIILKSGLLGIKTVQAILEEPENYIDSMEYFSWERYFTKVLMDYTEDTYLKYRKTKLNPAYLHEKNKEIILKSMEEIELSRQEN